MKRFFRHVLYSSAFLVLVLGAIATLDYTNPKGILNHKYFRVYGATQNPQPGACTVGGDVGRLFAARDTVTQLLTLFVCNKDAGGTTSWESYYPNSFKKFIVTKVANGVNACANANGCFTIADSTGNILSTTNAAAAGYQVLSGFSSSGTYIDAIRLKTLTICSGAIQFQVTSIGTTANQLQYKTGANYQLMLAVSSTNYQWPVIAAAPPTTTADPTVLALTLEASSNIDANIVAGCQFEMDVRYNTLP